MKFLLVIISVVYASVDCPDRCWTIENGICVPDQGKMSLDCSEIGHVSVILDPCLFIPNDVDTRRNYTVATVKNSAERNIQPGCIKNIENKTAPLVWTWTYAEAAECDWGWSTEASQLVFSASLRSSCVNEVALQDQVITVGTAAEVTIDLQCNFDNMVSVSANYSGESSDATQTGNVQRNVSLANGFSTELFDASLNAKTTFTVGEALSVKVKYLQIFKNYIYTFFYSFPLIMLKLVIATIACHLDTLRKNVT